MKQMNLNRQDFKRSQPFGGELLKRAKYRTARPLSTKKAMHVVIRSSQATGPWSFKRFDKEIERILNSAAKRFGVRVYSFANAGNHLHLIIKLGNRFTYAGFIRSITGAIALKVTRASKLKKLKQRFFDRRPYSRVVEWGRAFRIAKDYVQLNFLEAIGALPYSPGRLRQAQVSFDWYEDG